MGRKHGLRTTSPQGKPATPVQGTPVNRIQSVQWQGPVPPPQALEAFGKIDASFPERIMRMAELASDHGRAMESEAMRQQKDELEGARESKRRGQWFAAVLAMFFGLVGGFVCFLGHPASGATIITGTVVSLAAVYLIGKASTSENGH